MLNAPAPTTNASSSVDRLLRALDYDPTLGQAQLSASCSSPSGFQVTVASRDHETVVDEPHSLGGHDEGPNPIELLLGALGACQVITYRLWADRLGITLDTVDVDVRATLDLRGLLGATATGADDGLTPIEVRVTLSGPDEPEAYAALRRTVDERSPALRVLQEATQVRTQLRLG